jgi:hypothetical protein
MNAPITRTITRRKKLIPFATHRTTAGQMIQSHIQGNRCLIVTNDRIAPMFLEKYQTMIQAAGGDRLKVGTSFFFLDM